MKKFILSLLIGVFLFSCSEKKPVHLSNNSVERVLLSMTLEEKIQLLIGGVNEASHPHIPGTATTFAVPQLGIPSLLVTDGFYGFTNLTINQNENDNHIHRYTNFPSVSLMTSSWNTELVEKVGSAIGNQALECGIDVLHIPRVNIQRNPMDGHTYYSEDPVLSGQIGGALVKGIQSNGIAASLNYFPINIDINNSQENDNRITPRALREIYLKTFQIAIRESDPWAVMSNNNKINGTQISESSGLLRTILRNEWGFDGMVISNDFNGTNTPGKLRAGSNLILPGYPQQYDDIVAGLNNGTLKQTDINRNVTQILKLIKKTSRLKDYSYSYKPDLDDTWILHQAATEGIVLLKNNKQVLPLASGIKNIAAYGISSYDFITGHNNTKNINTNHNLSLIKGLVSLGYTLDTNLQQIYEEYLSSGYRINQETSYSPDERAEEFVPDAAEIVAQAKVADVALITIGRPVNELSGRNHSDDYELTAKERRLLDSVCDAFQSVGKKVIVILNISGTIETKSWKNLPDGILLTWISGKEGGNAVADILSGKANPSGKLTMTFPYEPNIISSSNTGSTPDSGYTVYTEDIYVGYRYFDSFRKEVSYPFGYGLSYTTFTYKNCEIKEEKNEFIVNIDITNTGNRSGKEIVQLYMAAPINPDLPKPLKELKAFAKTNELKPGEKQTLVLKINKKDMASFNESEGSWTIDRGNYKFLLGASSQDIRLMMDIQIYQSIIHPVNPVLLPREPIKVLTP